jgi:hypothetical protein
VPGLSKLPASSWYEYFVYTCYPTESSDECSQLHGFLENSAGGAYAFGKLSVVHIRSENFTGCISASVLVCSLLSSLCLIAWWHDSIHTLMQPAAFISRLHASKVNSEISSVQNQLEEPVTEFDVAGRHQLTIACRGLLEY